MNQGKTVNLACPVCENSETGFFVTKNDYAFNRCVECDFIFLNPMPEQDELNEQYTEGENELEPACNKPSSRLRRAFLKLPRFFPYAVGKKTLDFGCGGGFVANALSYIASESNGIDINQSAIAYAKQNFKRANYFCMDFTQLLETKEKCNVIKFPKLFTVSHLN